MASAVHSALARAYPQARCELDHSTPFELLIATVLSAQSTDRRVNTVTPPLFARFPTPLALSEADRGDVEEIILSVGLFRAKSAAIIGLARRIVDEFDGRVPSTLDELITLPAVGRKTANVVLGNAFGVPGVTPDTHLIRVSGRLGWTRSTKPDVVERDVAALFPPEDWVMLCHRVIWHGRRCCHSRWPACGACPVRGVCPSSGIGEQDPATAARLIREPRG